MRALELTGQRFGRLVVIERSGSKNNKAMWKCKCECGGYTNATSQDLKKGHTQSCGCYQREMTSKASKKHGMRFNRIYNTWLSMKQRCFNPHNPRYSDWGGRGITVCDEWKNSFEAFYVYVSKLPHYGETGYTMDRINNDGNYEPNNIRWATIEEQNKNKRKNKRSKQHYGVENCKA